MDDYYQETFVRGLEEQLEGEFSLQKDANPWRDTLSQFRMRPLVAELARALQAEAESTDDSREACNDEEQAEEPQPPVG